MSSITDVRVLTIPPCKMVSSGLGFFGEDNFTRFDQWFSQFPFNPLAMPKDFLWYDPVQNKMVWWYLYEEGMDTSNFPIVSFDGGIYISAVSKDGDDDDGNRVYEAVKQWIEESEQFTLDERPEHYTMSHIITAKETREKLGYNQLEILVPVK